MHTDDPAQLDAYQRLLFAVLGRAWEDAHGRNAHERAAARVWLYGDGLVSVCDWLGLDPDCLRERVGGVATVWNTKKSVTRQHPTPKKERDNGQ